MGETHVQTEASAPAEFDTLVAELLREGHAVRFRAPGQSMRPTILDGDILVVEPLHSTRVHLGSIVLYAVEGKPIAHRVMGRWRGAWLTRGDAYRGLTETVLPENVLGTVRHRIHGASCSQLDSRAARWSGLLRAYGMTLVWMLATLRESVKIRVRRITRRAMNREPAGRVRRG